MPLIHFVTHHNQQRPLKPSHNKCPVCGEPITNRKIDQEGGTRLEETFHCGDHYSYEFAYGSERWYIGEREFLAHWTDTPEVNQKLWADMKACAEEESKRWAQHKYDNPDTSLSGPCGAYDHEDLG